MILKKRAAKLKKSVNITGSHRLLLRSIRFDLRYWRHLLPIVIIGVAVNIIFQFTLSTEVASFYQTIWFIMISCSLIWVVRHAEDKSTKITIGNAFYKGSAPALKFFLVMFVVALTTIPFSIGAFIYSVINTIGSNVERLLAGGLWLGFVLITLFILTRFAFALLIITLPDINPISSLRLSWRLTNSKVNALVIRLGVFCLYMAIVSILVVAGASLLTRNTNIMSILLQLLGGLVLMPVSYTYLYQLYKEIR